MVRYTKNYLRYSTAISAVDLSNGDDFITVNIG